jgi:prephenate dehydrogenase
LGTPRDFGRIWFEAKDARVDRTIVGIIGTGLIGASIGLRARGAGHAVVGYDASDEALAAAIEAGAIERAVSRGELLACAGIVVIAAPIDATIGEIGAMRESPEIRAGLVIDVASVKGPVAVAAHGLANFVGTHPMAGSERSGAAAARTDLFEGKPWLYVPPGNATLEERARAFIELMGANPSAVDAGDHDRIVALTSHLPQLLAFAFARRVGRLGDAADPMCGPVARELLRIGNSSPSMWDSIFGANRENIEEELRALLAELF